MELSIQEENEKKKEFLRSYCKSLRREERIEEDIQELRMRKIFPGCGAGDGMPHGSDQTDLSDYIVILDELMEDLKQKINYGPSAIMRWYTNNTQVVTDKFGNKQYQKIEPKLRKNDGFMAFLVAMYSKDLLEEVIMYV